MFSKRETGVTIVMPTTGVLRSRHFTTHFPIHLYTSFKRGTIVISHTAFRQRSGTKKKRDTSHCGEVSRLLLELV